MRTYNLVWWVYISYCTDCTYSILYKQKTDKNRGDNVGFQIIIFCVSTMWYFYNKQPRSKTISCGRMYWLQQGECHLKRSIKNNSYLLLNILDSQFPWCSSGPGKLFCWGRGSPPLVHRRSPRVPRGPEGQTIVPLSLIPADRFHCYFRDNCLLFIFDEKKQHDHR